MALPVRGLSVMPLLNAVPVPVTTAGIARCRKGLIKSRSALFAQLQRLGRAGKVIRITRGREVAWVSRKWVDKAGSVLGVPQMAESLRDKLPDRRKCITQKVKVGRQTVHYSIGMYADGRPGELFIEVAKAGAALRTWAGEAAMMVSIALQHGTPLATVVDLFIGTRCEPCGPVEGHPRIISCTSVMDLIARDLAITFLGREEVADTKDWNDYFPLPEPKHFEV